MGRPGTCFETASRFIINEKPATHRYVEGFAMRRGQGDLIHHAWITLPGSASAIDLVWEPSQWTDEPEYFGVEFSTVSLARLIVRRRYYGLLDPVDDEVRHSLGLK
jgi:hypothetical protein